MSAKTGPKNVSPKNVSPKNVSPKQAGPEAADSLNLCLVRGECSASPDLRTLASGTRLAVLAVRVRSAGAAATSVPVAVWDPPAHVEDLEAGSDVVVLGRVVRRFFRTGAGAPGSRVEVRAELVAPAGDKRKVTQALRRAARMLDDLDARWPVS